MAKSREVRTVHVLLHKILSQGPSKTAGIDVRQRHLEEATTGERNVQVAQLVLGREPCILVIVFHRSRVSEAGHSQEHGVVHELLLYLLLPSEESN